VSALQKNDVVAGGSEAGEVRGTFRQGIQNREAVAGKDGEDAQGTLLEFVVRGQGFAQDALVMVEELNATISGTAGPGAELFELVEHFAFGDVERTRKGGVELAEGFADASEVAAEIAFADRHLAGEGAGNGFALELVTKMLAAAQDVANANAVLAEDAGDMGLDEREAGAGEYGGHTSEQVVVDDFGLGEIGELRGANDAGRGRQERILHDGTKQRAGGEIAGSAISEREELIESEGARAGLE